MLIALFVYLAVGAVVAAGVIGVALGVVPRSFVNVSDEDRELVADDIRRGGLWLSWITITASWLPLILLGLSER